MTAVFQSAFMQALGWSLVDSLWQMGAVWMMYAIITGNSTRFSAAKRHWLALMAIGSGTLLFLLGLAINIYAVTHQQHVYSLAYVIEQQVSGLSVNNLFSNFIPYFGVIYVPAVLFFAMRLIINVSRNKNRYVHNLTPASNEVTDFVNETIAGMRIPRPVKVWVSETVSCALTLGFWKPVIILPIAVFSHLNCSQVQAVLTHELYHVKRNDYLLNIFLTVTDVIFFFNPFARLLTGIVKKERENSCDDQVLLAGFSAIEYSEALYILGRYRFQQNNLAIAATGMGKEFLLQRIRRIMNRENPAPAVVKPLLAFFLCLVVAIFAGRTVKETPDPVSAKLPVAVETKAVAVIKPAPLDAKPLKPLIAKKKVSNAVTAEPPLPPPPPDMPPPESENEMRTTFAAAPVAIEFTIIDHPAPTPAEQVIGEKIHPYVPGSAFYYTEIDTTAGRKVITL